MSKKPVILCIDDEKIVLNSLKIELKENFGEHHSVELFEDPEDAFDTFSELLADGYEVPLIISDYIMPNIKGDELLKKIHDISPKTLKIMLTGQATTEGVTNAVNWARLYRYISKPWSSEDLAMTVREAIKSYFQDKLLEKQNDELRKINDELEQRVHDRTLEISQKNIILEIQKNELNVKNKNIIDSIVAAKRIQQALLPSETTLKKCFSDYFILYKPKDIVSGDFYWVKQIKNYVVIAAADCTGHGVPGALMSILGISSLNEITNSLEVKDFVNVKASNILETLRDKIIRAFHKTDSIFENKEGMDISLCIVDLERSEIQYSGAFNSLCISGIRNGTAEFNEVKADKIPVGYMDELKQFTNHVVSYNKGDFIYLFSDGYADQFGGAMNKKFMNKKFKSLLSYISERPICEQKQILEITLNEWKGSLSQIDDILVMGIQL